MLVMIKYLPVYIIVLISSNIRASKLPEDCDYGDCGGATGYFASGSAYSSQVLLPDGTVVTNSKGSSVSSDGVQRTFHELKQEADKYVSNNEPKTGYINRNEHTNRLPILKVPEIQGMPDTAYIAPSQREFKAIPQYSSQQQYTEEQKQLPSPNANLNPYMYQQAQPSIQDQGNLQQESENTQVSGSSNPAPNPNQQPSIYYPQPLDIQQDIFDSNVETDNKLAPADGSESTTPLLKKIRSYSQHSRDANTHIPASWMASRASKFSNGINMVYKNQDGVYQFLPNLIPCKIYKCSKEEHYPQESYSKSHPAPGEQPGHDKVPTDDVKRTKLGQYSQYVAGQDRTTTVAAAGNNGRRVMVVIGAPATAPLTSSLQPTLNPHPTDASFRPQNVLSDLPQMDAAPQPNYYLMAPPVPSSNGQAKDGSQFDFSLPILVHGVPHNVGLAYPHLDSKAQESARTAMNPDADSSPNDTGAPQDKSSSSNLHYFSTNGNVGELLVPNSDIYVPADADISSMLRPNTNLCPTCVPNSVALEGSPKKSYGFATLFSSHSSNVNGKKSENREASVTVNDNGKIDSYHVKS